jgi:hypothetical protein
MLLLAFQAAPAQSTPAALVLKTDHYVATIYRGCVTAKPNCDPPELALLDATGISTARFRGRLVFTACGKKVCALDGYEFSTATVRYFVSMSGNLSITSGMNKIVDEPGKWIDK